MIYFVSSQHLNLKKR